MFSSTTNGTSGFHWNIISSVVCDTKINWIFIVKVDRITIEGKNMCNVQLSIWSLHSCVSCGYIIKFIAHDNVNVNLEYIIGYELRSIPLITYIIIYKYDLYYTNNNYNLARKKGYLKMVEEVVFKIQSAVNDFILLNIVPNEV